MHIPDGFLDGPTTIGTDLAAVAAVAACLRPARSELAERPAPLAGLVAAFVFAVQLASVPLAAGTSAHLLGGVLAAVLVGPATAVLSSVTVLGVQSLLLGYGGVTALGASALVMDIVDRKSTRLNSSHVEISYAVFCFKKNSELDQARNGVALNALAFQPGGNMLAAGGMDGILRIWVNGLACQMMGAGAAQGQCEDVPHRLAAQGRPLRALAWSPDCFLITPGRQNSTLFPYTTLFR